MNFRQKMLAYSAVATVIATFGGSAVSQEVNLEYHQEPMSDPLVREIWGERAAAAQPLDGGKIAPWAIVAKVTLADGGEITVSQLGASNECTINQCPVRIMKDGKVTADFMACDLEEHHSVNASGSLFIACDSIIPTGIR